MDYVWTLWNYIIKLASKVSSEPYNAQQKQAYRRTFIFLRSSSKTYRASYPFRGWTENTPPCTTSEYSFYLRLRISHTCCRQLPTSAWNLRHTQIQPARRACSVSGASECGSLSSATRAQPEACHTPSRKAFPPAFSASGSGFPWNSTDLRTPHNLWHWINPLYIFPE